MRVQVKTKLATAAGVIAAAAFAATAAQGQVPSQFVITGKAAERMNDRISINSATALFPGSRRGRGCGGAAKSWSGMRRR